jgi:hypothetical protein
MSARGGDDRAVPDDEVDLPPRLFGDPGLQGQLVRRYLRRPHGGSEERAWQRLASGGVEGKAIWQAPRRRRLAIGAFTLAAAASLAAIVLIAFRSSTPRSSMPSPTLAASAERSAPLPASSPSREGALRTSTNGSTKDSAKGVTIALGSVASPLARGRWTISGEASGELSPDGLARAELGVGGAPILTLLSGRVSLAVTHRDRPMPFRVVSPPYVFTDLGTKFQVERRTTTIELAVIEGRVSVARGGRLVATIDGGGTWSGPLSSNPPRKNESVRRGSHAAPIAHVATASAPPRDGARPCAAGMPLGDRLSCLRDEANGSGLSAETALYEIAKLTRDEGLDPMGALTILEELRHRFPSGALRAETDLSIVELEARTGRYTQALDESAALLARGVGEREAELHLLRGNLYREGLGDLSRAADEYRLAAARASRRATADEAAFLQAIATEALGRRTEAADLFRRYLARPQPVHETQARTRLDRLTKGFAGRSP